MGPIAGKHKLKIDSETFVFHGAPTFEPGGETKTSIALNGGGRATSIEDKVAYIEGTLAFAPELDVAEFKKMKNKTVVLTCPNGQSWVFSDCEVIGDVSVNGDDGSVSFRIESDAEAKILLP